MIDLIIKIKYIFKKDIDRGNFLFNVVPSVAISWSVLNILHQKSFSIVISSPKQQLRLVLLFIFFYFLIKYFKIAYLKIILHYNLRSFWHHEFHKAIERVFLTFSLFGIIYLTNNRIIEISVLGIIFIISYFFLRQAINRHPESAKSLVLFGDGLFGLTLYIFVTAIFFQNFALKFYTSGNATVIDNLIVYRSLAIASFWLILLSFLALISRYYKKNKYWLIILWLLAYFIVLLIELVNAGVIYYSGLYINPIVLEHAIGGGAVIFSVVNIFIISLLLIVPVLFLLVFFIFFYKRSLIIKDKYWQAFFSGILMIGLLALAISVPLVGNLPEKIIIYSFYDYYSNQTKDIVLNDVALKKLEKFGLFYNQDDFIVSQKNKITTSSDPLLPLALQNQQPNIIFISLESFSSKLVQSVGGSIDGLTPNIDAFSLNSDTTVFKNFYNASTPTVTGLIAQMCSFLPPTGHREIGKNNSFNNYLICLPKVMKDNGYKSLAYITAVDKEYVGKSQIFRSMGFDDIYGANEITDYMKQVGKSTWGMTDHQQFLFLLKLIKEKTTEPFFLMLSTIDSHQPFNMSQDAINFKNGDSDLLNAVHSTDDAVGKFLTEFKTSDLAAKTIIILAADHALFPKSYLEKYFPNVSSENLSYYDETVLMINIPKTILPKQIDIYSSSIDIAPTIMDLLGFNSSNYFDGHSIFADRIDYPNVLGMHEFGLYINQVDQNQRSIKYSIPQELNCSSEEIFTNIDAPLSLCEYLEFYKWKRKMMTGGRLWLRNK